MEVTATRLTDLRAGLGESPLWDAAARRIRWVDVPGRRLLTTDPASRETTVTELPREVHAVRPMAGGGWVATAGLEICSLAPDGTMAQLVGVDHPVEGGFNDACCDPTGRLWAGTATSGPEAKGTLYRIGGSRCDPIVPGIIMSNGIGWSPDGRTLYYSDSAAYRVYAFDFDVAEGTVSNQHTFRAFEKGHIPDGLAVDAAGDVWLAVWGAGAVLRISPAGEVIGQVSVPTPHTTSCAFGGDNLDTLFITTARSDPPFADDGLGGAMFIASPGAKGMPPVPFSDF